MIDKDYEGKKLRVQFNQHNLFYTVKKVLSKDETHLYFEDRHGIKQGINLNNIVQIM